MSETDAHLIAEIKPHRDGSVIHMKAGTCILSSETAGALHTRMFIEVHGMFD
ncbi:hypothetical protein BC777_3560 [Yoonia maricola]|uniref:Uncharacterized protein n=1 Tax=Yoonia maricola TaxID=420999 RepID=A0A2M8W0Q5_9RHOB|nr:hypothetical protein [Yoonia maricola]PJI84500.1 hypothetical protein BC777_3560 [Yoonia maricola]